MPAFDRQAEYFKGGGFAGAEAYHIHRPYLDRLGEYDPRVGQARAARQGHAAPPTTSTLGCLRAASMREVEARCAPFDAIVMPTVPCIAPTIAEASRSDEDYFRWNVRILRNTGLVNFLDGCAASRCPATRRAAAPVGFMVCGPAMSDRRMLAVAAAIERALSRA